MLISPPKLWIRTLKQRDKVIYGSVPVANEYQDAMKLVHSFQKRQKQKLGRTALLLLFLRVMGWKHVKAVMDLAGIQGEPVSPKGLWHGFGVRLAQKTHNSRIVLKLLGHKYLETTAIYMDMVGEEERAEVIGVW